ncbi:rod shape-determining protein MreC [Filimonas lacunae]|uniref:Cell shape-determining protein MreC n=1 Tax=Filimonas lacunae TaxID=477680 RepID=A0A173MPH7_9BACT|nr:rod shape-determining protein MreC [Filimonas lacunae]BAV09268.1 Rod shape-determining protein MreC [Filimonas lacunae]SIS70129.1 rod shape-determining protein MreC [Filimonas lacunae]
MRNIILFIRRFFILVVFFVLQGICIAILVKYNKTYEAVFANSALEVTGRVDNQYNKVEYFFHLKETNKQLAEENARLRNMLASNYIGPETSVLHQLDTTFRDTVGRVRMFTWLPAKVVNNSFAEENNYLTLQRGSNQGVVKDMAVTGPDGIVGKVVMVSGNYCRVMSLLNRNSKVSAMLKKELYTGAVDWDGADPRFITLRNIPKSAKVLKGDTVLTSNLSGNYPPGLVIGTIDQVQAEQASNFYTLRIKTATNFFNLQYAYLIQNEQWQEQRALEAQTTK